MRKSNIQLSFALLVILEFVIALLTFEDLGLGFIPLLFNPGVHLIFGYIGLSLCLKNDERRRGAEVRDKRVLLRLLQYSSPRG